MVFPVSIVTMRVRVTMMSERQRVVFDDGGIYLHLCVCVPIVLLMRSFMKALFPLPSLPPLLLCFGFVYDGGVRQATVLCGRPRRRQDGVSVMGM